MYLSKCANDIAFHVACPRGGRNKISLPKDVSPSAQRCYQFFILPLASCHLLRIRFGWVSYPGNPCCRLYAYYWITGFLRSSHHTDRGTLPWRCTTDLIRDTW